MTSDKPTFTRGGLKDVSRALRANMHDAGVIEGYEEPSKEEITIVVLAPTTEE